MDKEMQSRRAFAVPAIRRYLVAYLESRNPLFLWKIYVECEFAHLPQLKIVREYLYGVAQRLGKLDPEEGETGAEALAALRLSSTGQGTRFSRAKLTDNKITAYMLNDIYDGDSKRIAEEFGKSERTIRSWLKDVRDVVGN